MNPQNRDNSWDWFDEWVEGLELESADRESDLDQDEQPLPLAEQRTRFLRALLRASELEKFSDASIDIDALAMSNKQASKTPPHGNWASLGEQMWEFGNPEWPMQHPLPFPLASEASGASGENGEVWEGGLPSPIFAYQSRLTSSRLNGELKAADFLAADLLVSMPLIDLLGGPELVEEQRGNETKPPRRATAPQNRALRRIRGYIQNLLHDNSDSDNE